MPEHAAKIRPVLYYSGIPITAQFINDSIVNQEKQ